MRIRALAVLTVAVVAAGCGVADDDTASSDVAQPAVTTTAGVLPATTMLVPLPFDAPPIESVAPAAVDRPCPVSDGSPDGGDGMRAELARVEPMLGQVLAYGGEHPDEFGTYGLVWHAGDDASVFISFTSNLDVHRAALEAVVPHPDELIVCQVAVSGEVARTIEATLVAELQGRFLSIGRGAGAIEVTLAPGEEQLAGELTARYGSALDLRVGALAYPIERAVSVCTAVPDENPLPGMEITLVPSAEPIVADGHGWLNLEVVLSNAGDTPIRFDSGTAIGAILDAGGNVISSSDTLAIADVGTPVDLAPGGSTELPLVSSTSSCDPGLGYVIPPGDYQIVVEIPYGVDELVSAPLPIAITG